MKLQKFDLTTKTALITGAAGLLGLEHAAALLDCGARVVLTDVNEHALNKAYKLMIENYDKSKILKYSMDVARPESVRNVCENLSDANVRVDILINNAAIDPKVKDQDGLLETSRLESFSYDQWSLELSVGLTGAFICAQTFGSAMAKDGLGGVIINIASDLSIISPDQRLYRKVGLPEHLQPVKPITYSVIKAGLVGMTRYLSTYWAANGVRCNALSPGGVFNGQNKEFVSGIENLIPLGRMADLDEYRGTIQYLCSDASAYMNGQNIVIDGGRSVL